MNTNSRSTTMQDFPNGAAATVAILVDCDNVPPEILPSLLTSESAEGKVGLSALGQYLKRTDPAFSPKTFGHSGLLDMVKTCDLLGMKQEPAAVVIKQSRGL